MMLPDDVVVCEGRRDVIGSRGWGDEWRRWTMVFYFPVHMRGHRYIVPGIGFLTLYGNVRAVWISY